MAFPNKVRLVSVEVEFYNFEFWVANNLQNQEMDCKSPLGHRGGASQGAPTVKSMTVYNNKGLHENK